MGREGKGDKEGRRRLTKLGSPSFHDPLLFWFFLQRILFRIFLGKKRWGSHLLDPLAAATGTVGRRRQQLGKDGGGAVAQWVAKRQCGGSGRIASAPNGGGSGGGGSVD